MDGPYSTQCKVCTRFLLALNFPDYSLQSWNLTVLNFAKLELPNFTKLMKAARARKTVMQTKSCFFKSLNSELHKAVFI